MYYKPTII